MSNNNTKLILFYVGYLQRAPDPDGFDFWMRALEGGTSLADIAKSFASEPETVSLSLKSESTQSQDPRSLLNDMFLNIFGRDGDADGLDFWVAAHEGGLLVDQIMFELILAAQGSDIQAIENKAAVATQFLDIARADPFFEMTPEIIQRTRSSLNLVTADATTVFIVDGPNDIIKLNIIALNKAVQETTLIQSPKDFQTVNLFDLLAANDAPVAVADTATTLEDTLVNIAVLGNDTDVDGDALTVTSATALNGTVVIKTDGTLDYTPIQDFNGNDTIIYIVSDPDGLTSTAQVVVSVSGAAEAVYDETINGTAAADTIVFTSSSTLVNAGEGANTITGTSGDNLIIAGAGADTITVTSGDNKIEAGDGANIITATEGDNTIISGAGADNITVLSGDNIIEAGDGANIITATEGDNTITSGAGADTITVTSGDNKIEAGDGANVITATEGDNMIISGAGSDKITVTSGDNIIEAGDGANTIIATSGVNTIKTGSGADNITTGGLTGGGNSINAGDGANIINIGAGDDTVMSGNNADTITTGGGDDVINAGGGNDKMTGGTGSDDFIFMDGFGINLIIDFDTSDDDEDIDLSTLTGITSYTDLTTNHLRSNSINEAVIFDDANTITLAGVSTADLSKADFIFSDALVAVADIATTLKDTLVNIAVLGNDTSIYGDTLTVTTATALNGTVLIRADGTLDYTPIQDFNGNDTITYIVSDPYGLTSTANVTVAVSAMNEVNGTEAAENPLNGTNGADFIKGNGGADHIYGLLGDDTINGGAGADHIFGGEGNDILTGDVGADHFFVTSGLGDVITDFAVASDKISFGSGAGSVGNYHEDSAAAEFATAKVAAEDAFNGTIIYSAQQIGGDVYVFVDNDSDNVTDISVKLAGLSLAGVGFADIIA